MLFDVAEEIVGFGAVFLDLELLLLSPPLPGSAREALVLKAEPSTLLSCMICICIRL